jgi:hypothetical protein
MNEEGQRANAVPCTTLGWEASEKKRVMMKITRSLGANLWAGYFRCP